MAKQVWYFEDSPVAPLARKLPKGYSGRSVPRGETANGAGPGAQIWLADYTRDAKALDELARPNPGVRVVYLLKAKARPPGNSRNAFVFLPAQTTPALLARTLDSAFETGKLAVQAATAEDRLQKSYHEIQELNRIGVALSSERNPEKLFHMILDASRKITSSDAGSLYMVEDVSEKEKLLRFQLTQNTSLETPFTEFTMPLDYSSVAGYVASTGEALHIPDAYEIPESAPYKVNRSFDESTGYRTKSMLTIPLKTPKGEVLGVLQLINCKRSFSQKLDFGKDFEKDVIPFQDNHIALAGSLASQAAVAYENSVLYENIQALFEGFVKAAVTAIEQRDPTTSGHSFRVSQMTCGLAETADKLSTGPLRELSFTRDQMKELRYAALLHDFGKVGVKEEVLIKAKKLYPEQLNIILHRFDYIRKELEAGILRRKLEAIQQGQPPEALAALDTEYRSRLAELDDYRGFVLEANEPTVLPEGNFEKLLDIARRSYPDPQGIERPFITPGEVRFLSIPKGSLDSGERQQIESHVIHTFNFLTQIPWTKDLKGVPLIARGHHEKLNGSGYPYSLTAPDIPPQTRIMTITDMFDALSASDRPYKKAVPTQRALDILADCVKTGELDSVLFDLFLEAKIYQLTAKH